MSRNRLLIRRRVARRTLPTAPTPAPNSGTAEDIGFAALALARRAQAAGLNTISYLLECVALEAGAEAAAHGTRADAPET
ncbi:MAG: hypothetical protein ACRECV_13845 [Xanthobacteraceae bacterium]